MTDPNLDEPLPAHLTAAAHYSGGQIIPFALAGATTSTTGSTVVIAVPPKQPPAQPSDGYHLRGALGLEVVVVVILFFALIGNKVHTLVFRLRLP